MTSSALVGHVLVRDGEPVIVVRLDVEGHPGGALRRGRARGVERHREPPRRRRLQHGAGHVGDAGAVDAAVLPQRAHLPVGDVAVPPVRRGQVGVGERVPHPLRGALDVGDVHVVRPFGHGVLLGPAPDGAQRAQARAFEFLDPAFGDVPERDRVEVVQFLPAPADGGDEVGRLQQAQVLGRRLPRHVERLAQLPEGLPVAFAQPVQQRPPRRIGQRLEHRVILDHPDTMQVFTCICQAIIVCRGVDPWNPGRMELRLAPLQTAGCAWNR